ncbi:MAG: class I SAM-dependent methyltransferase [Alphaproteobacteria bacterium]|nr:class I SAM-dependent methyltransferase [Alphaproteobacteria bacterium]
MEAQQSETMEKPAVDAGCPACGAPEVRSFYKVSNIPVNSCVLMRSPQEAVTYPRGDIDMCFCGDCGFIFNRAFDPGLIEYSERYEETQGFSETFNAFHEALAERLIDRYDLRGKKVIEIGCGKGEFLTMLCELGENEGTGFDPSYVADRSRAEKTELATFVTDFYSEQYANHTADFLCCKMTLEHIPAVGNFVAMVRRAVESNPDTVVFFQVPEVSLILEQFGFWDMYYEHCSYFSPASLRELFERCGYSVKEVWIDYGDQYLMIEALPTAAAAPDASRSQAEIRRLADMVDRFEATVPATIVAWQGRLRALADEGKKVVLWGSGSKAVSMLTTLGIKDELECVVDINPHRQGMFMPGTGHAIVSPESLACYKPDHVIIMNPIYRGEISKMLQDMDLHPQISTVVEMP